MANDDVFTKIPQEIIFQILTKLPSYALLQLRCVSKSFNSLISHPDFLNLHLSSASASAAVLHHHLIYYEPTDYMNSYFSFHVGNTFSLCKTLRTPFRSVNGYFRIVGSSRGVVCLFDTNYFAYVGAVILWNPFIGKFKILPSLLNSLRSNISTMVVGFGFDHRTTDFKVVKILYNSDFEFQPKAYVYGLKTGSWRSIQLSVPCFMPKSWCSSVFVNGVVHWLAYKQKPEFNARPNCIMGFDVVEEVFKSIELPRNLGANCWNLRLSHLVDEKSLALFVHCRDNMVETWGFWLMNGYGKVESWTKKYTIVIKEVLFPLKIVNGVELLAATSDDKLVLIDLEKEESKDLDVCGLAPSFYTTSYEPSLALLDTGEQVGF